MPRVEIARLIERPPTIFPSRGSARLSKRSTSYPRRPRYAASKPPANPLPIRTNYATFRVNHEHKNTASGDAAGYTAKPLGKRRAHGSARINLRIRNAGKQERLRNGMAFVSLLLIRCPTVP